MPRTIVIRFNGASDPTLIHRIRNLGEDLYREFQENGQAAMDITEVDRATDTLRVTLAASRHLGAVLNFIKSALRHHHLEKVAEVKK
jgi:hypothetical protein